MIEKKYKKIEIMEIIELKINEYYFMAWSKKGKCEEIRLLGAVKENDLIALYVGAKNGTSMLYLSEIGIGKTKPEARKNYANTSIKINGFYASYDDLKEDIKFNPCLIDNWINISTKEKYQLEFSPKRGKFKITENKSTTSKNYYMLCYNLTINQCFNFISGICYKYYHFNLEEIKTEFERFLQL